MNHKRAILAVILSSYLMIVLDISIVITALPEIQDTLGFSRTALSWVQNAYLLAFGGLLLLGARAGDLLGRRRMFIAGLAVFTIASLGVGSAQSEAWLIAARALQGIGAAILTPSTLALLQTSFAEGPERTRAIAYYAAVAGVGASIGLVLGGMLAGWLSWRVRLLHQRADRHRNDPRRPVPRRARGRFRIAVRRHRDGQHRRGLHGDQLGLRQRRAPARPGG
jgi:MFS family permease